MAIENVKEILEKLMADPKAQELFKGLEPPRSEEEKALKLIEVAKKLSYDLDAADLADYLKKASADRKEKTDAQAEVIQKLDDSELEKTAGGKSHHNCKDTFQDRENCWWNDACDLSYLTYPEYLCSRNQRGKRCNLQEMMECQEFIS